MKIEINKSRLIICSVVVLVANALPPNHDAFARGFAGGGARPNIGGGGGARPSMGGGGMSRPNVGGGGGGMARPNMGGGGGRPNVGSISRPNVSNMPSVNNRPSMPTSRPNVGGSGASLGGISRPNLPSQSLPSIGSSRPGSGTNLPSTGISRPSMPDVSNRPSVRPPGSLPSVTRPAFSERPTTLPAFPDRPSLGNTRPSLPERPTTLPAFPDRPSLGGTRPSLPERPTTLPAMPDRPSLGGTRPSLPERPTTLPAFPDRPSIGGGNRPSLPERPTTLPAFPDRPSLGGGNRPNVPERPVTLPDRPWLGGGERPILPDRPSIGGNRPDRPSWGGNGNNIGNNIGNNNNNVNINWNNRPNWGWNSGWGLNPGWGWNSGWGWNGPNHWSNQWGNHPWFHGVWSGNWINRWYRPPSTFFIGWGLGTWSGAGTFYNPYFVPSTTAPFNYSEPIVINNFNSTDASTSNVTNVSQSPNDPNGNEQDDNSVAMAMFNDGLAAFKNGQYSQAQVKFDSAIAKLPGDAVVHEMRALTYFALGSFQQAAAVLNSLLATTPGMDWTTMSSLYGNIDDYTKQLRALEQHVKDNPSDAAASFVLAYHYLVTGHKEDSIEALQTVVRLMPKDTTAQRLLDSLLPPPAQPSAIAGKTSKKTDSAAETPEVDLVGSWQAKTTGATIVLTIDEKSGFIWNAAPEGQPAVELNGNLTSTGDRLILETETQGSMVGDVTPLSTDKFQFQIAGGPPQDPGLTFLRKR